MKVSELIEELKSMPQDMEVAHLWDGAPRTLINHVWLARDGYVVTADDRMVCYETGARPINAPTEEEDRYWESPTNKAKRS